MVKIRRKNSTLRFFFLSVYICTCIMYAIPINVSQALTKQLKNKNQLYSLMNKDFCHQKYFTQSSRNRTKNVRPELRFFFWFFFISSWIVGTYFKPTTIWPRQDYLHFDSWWWVPDTLPCGQIGIHVFFGTGFDYLHPFPSENRIEWLQI